MGEGEKEMRAALLEAMEEARGSTRTNRDLSPEEAVDAVIRVLRKRCPEALLTPAGREALQRVDATIVDATRQLRRDLAAIPMTGEDDTPHRLLRIHNVLATVGNQPPAGHDGAKVSFKPGSLREQLHTQGYIGDSGYLTERGVTVLAALKERSGRVGP